MSKCCRSLKRHNSIARAAKGIGSEFVHHTGHPINQHTNAGFNRWREVGHGGDDICPKF
jgi:hypothetical protein